MVVGVKTMGVFLVVVTIKVVVVAMLVVWCWTEVLVAGSTMVLLGWRSTVMVVVTSWIVVAGS